MLVEQRMSRPVIAIHPDMPIHDVRKLFSQEKIRRAPVIKNGKLIGIVSDKDLIDAAPSPATSLSVWEMNYLLSKIQIKDIMTKDVITIDEDTPIEQAARIMVDNKIGGLPVMRFGKVVGMITETDLFKVFLELMGAREKGVRVTALVEDKPGVLGEITRAVTGVGGNFIAFGQFTGEDVSTKFLTFKVVNASEKDIKEAIWDIAKEVQDIRTCSTNE
jgi:acetoin utilization protein AcuB